MKRELPRPCLMLVTEPHPELVEIVKSAIAGGVNVVQWRDKVSRVRDRSSELTGAAQELRPFVKPPNLLIVNGDYHASARAGADGAQQKRTPRIVLSEDYMRGLLGLSVHSVDEAREAEYGGADYVIAGTIYASQSHPDIAPQGVDYLHEVCKAVSIPVIAIGGITLENVGECIDAGAAGVAVLSPIMRAQDPQAAAREYSDALLLAWKAKQCS